ncbi:MAG: hypothetical protein QM808_12425 [Steroidobacteraceae bacterium]
MNTSPATLDSTPSLMQLNLLMHQISTGLPRLSPQHDPLLGQALLNLAVTTLINALGKEATASLMAATTEQLWSDEYTTPSACA